MSQPLPPLRDGLDFMPSPVEDRPGLLLRDPFHYTDAVLIIPPPFVECLACFDGQQTALDLRAKLVEITGDLQVGHIEEQLVGALSSNGFLEDETFEKFREGRERAFAESLVREPAHSGSGYPDDPSALRDLFSSRWMAPNGHSATPNGLIGIAAPHVSPEGGYESYRSAYQLLTPDLQNRTFIILGTSHYGAPDRFGLTRKSWRTPWGDSLVDDVLVAELERAAPGAITMEDYCHSVEHSIEFQVVFLQSIYGPNIRILPILCGSFARSIYFGGQPEDNEEVRRFFDALGEIAARDRNRLFWTLGIDMAHMGRRYGDDLNARANMGEMTAVESADRRRIDSIAAGDAQGFWQQVQENRDPLKWCGSSPVYTFLKAVPEARARLERYEQWNIDPDSVVSFAGISFR